MSERSLKKSLSEKTNRPSGVSVGDADENLDLFSVNRGDGLPSLDETLLKTGVKVVKHEASDVNDPLCTGFEVPLGTLSRLVLEARNVTSKLQAISTTKSASKSESDPSSKPKRSSSAIRPSNIPTLRPSNTGPTVRSSSVPKKTTSPSVSVSSPKRTISRSLTPVSRKTPSRSSTPSRISTSTSTTPSFKKAGEVQRSRSLTPRPTKPVITSRSSTPTSNSTKVRSVSVSSRPSVSPTPQTPPKLKEKVTLAFGRPVGTTTGNVNSPKRNTSPDVTRTRPKGSSPSSLIPTFSGSTPRHKPVKTSTNVVDSMRSGKKFPKSSVQIANNHHLDVSRNGKVSANPFAVTMLYPHSIRSSASSALRKRFGSEGSSGSSNQEEEDGKSLTKEGNINMEKKNSVRYDDLLNVNDVKDTNWLLNLDDDLNHSLLFDNAFDSPPEPFSPL